MDYGILEDLTSLLLLISTQIGLVVWMIGKLQVGVHLSLDPG